MELLAPAGSDRRALAELIAKRLNGSVRAFFHTDSEPSKVQGKPLFYHLTQGFAVHDAHGKLIAKCVDDITLQHDLNKDAPAALGWYRLVSDEIRLLRLIARHSQADLPIAASLQAVGELFGTQPQASAGGVYRLSDSTGASIALAAPLPGERERACELITAPLAAHDHDTLALLLDCATELGFLLPLEGATHLHFDGTPFCHPATLQLLVNTLHPQREALRQQLHTNPHCRRLGAWSESLLTSVNAADFSQLTWDEARTRLAQLSKKELTKYCDFNIRNIIVPTAGKHTVEVRILPSTLVANVIQAAIEQFQTCFAQVIADTR